MRFFCFLKVVLVKSHFTFLVSFFSSQGDKIQVLDDSSEDNMVWVGGQRRGRSASTIESRACEAHDSIPR